MAKAKKDDVIVTEVTEETTVTTVTTVTETPAEPEEPKKAKKPVAKAGKRSAKAIEETEALEAKEARKVEAATKDASDKPKHVQKTVPFWSAVAKSTGRQLDKSKSAKPIVYPKPSIWQ